MILAKYIKLKIFLFFSEASSTDKIPEGKIRVSLSNGGYYDVDHIILTVSLGVLQHKVRNTVTEFYFLKYLAKYR